MPQRNTEQRSSHPGADPAVEPGALADGTILTSAADGVPYLLQDGRRKRILSPAGVLAAGVDLRSSAAQQLTLSEDQLQRIPSAGMLAPAGTRQFDSGLMHLGANHWMRTWGVLDLGTGQVSAQTRTATFTWFGGYHGATYVIFGDADDAPVFQTGMHRYGVDGTVIGTSDRTDAWWESMPAADTARITRHAVFLTWAPDSFEKILGRWAESGEKVASLVSSVAAVAAVFAA
ncbi:hypothetical protein M2164_008358 [Streptomyces sp. SAI-208]|jgi:hypothetical protein|uniref:hypothetical protein n=1 Tax=unclassified Streptomyces TaxID=2593676 RepID=UPI002475A55E|nr:MULTISPECIES: hypothetical protein [unclassified Streptomyces]MDH6521654.1 hypothetical protein [Streptomyces sp. SAI-090]MDH6553944.1 hypothetical protein [Streptomyces sp. SAI-041]MDH6573022.1 hypothetical protein [Streptomyces sp. SAI-117]MDH6582016.1 hypothetical protein [Streptomyces sp. SAI-133]MDH6612723.1 hypothetical protein [Streptomyces sp. SAI-208]